MKPLILLFSLLAVGCSSSNWVVKSQTDEFTDQSSCKIVYGSDFGRGFTKGLGGIHYYPFIERSGNEVIFGIHNDYNIPVGDVQIRVDNNPAHTISFRETPVFYSATSKPVDLSYLKNTPGIDHKVLQDSTNSMVEDINKMSSPYTATTGKKAIKIISQMRKGKTLKLRVIGFATNTVRSTTGKYNLGDGLSKALNSCGIKLPD